MKHDGEDAGRGSEGIELRAEIASLKEQVRQLLTANVQLRQELKPLLREVAPSPRRLECSSNGVLRKQLTESIEELAPGCTAWG